MVRFLTFALSLFLTATPALAESRPPKTLSEAKAQFADADAKLNAVYARCTAPEAATVQAIGALRSAERQWIEVRDATARAYQLGWSGKQSLDDEYYFHGRTVVTLSRIEDLKSLFGCG